MSDAPQLGLIATRSGDVVAAIARQAPPLSEAARARVAALLKPQAKR